MRNSEKTPSTEDPSKVRLTSSTSLINTRDRTTEPIRTMENLMKEPRGTTTVIKILT